MYFKTRFDVFNLKLIGLFGGKINGKFLPGDGNEKWENEEGRIIEVEPQFVKPLQKTTVTKLIKSTTSPIEIVTPSNKKQTNETGLENPVTLSKIQLQPSFKETT